MTRRFLLTIPLIAILIASPAGAVEFGWQELPDGGIEFVVQVEPELVDSFQNDGFSSEIPPGLRDVRRIRITVGTEALPNQGNLSRPQSHPPQSAQEPEPEHPAARTFGQSGTPNATPPADAPADRQNESTTPEPPEPPLFDQEPPGASLPFFRPGRTRPPEPSDSSAVRPSTPPIQNHAADATSPPRLADSDGSRSNPASSSSPAAIDVAKPATPSGFEPKPAESSVVTDQPWATLMLVLMGLYVSVGINLYLVWIHQDIRLKLRAQQQKARQGAT